MITYKDKYLKYKNKYLQLKNNNQIGGYKLSDKTKGRILDTVLSNILKDNNNTLYFKFDDRGLKQEGYGFDETLEYLLYDKDYNLILPYLLDKYMNEKPYTQIFCKKNKEIISNFINMIPYHVNIGALMFLSFITELEIFTLFYSIIPFNTNTDGNRNSFNAAFCYNKDQCSKTRIYRDNVNGDITQIFTNFTKILDETFTNFCNSLIINIQETFLNIDINIIRGCIVPLESSLYNEDSKWDYIFADWKNRLSILYLEKVNKEENKEKILDMINQDIIKTLRDNVYYLFNYIAEATGFFSYIYLIYPENYDSTKPYFGSCTTYSMYELYIMSRLHIRGENIILLVEKETKEKHPYFKITQERTNIPVLTHFATKFILGKKDYNLRSLFESNGLVELSFRDNKQKILKIFIYIIYDMYIQYFSTLDSDFLKKNALLLEKINIFINERITCIEKKIGYFNLEMNSEKEIGDHLYNLLNESKSKILKIDIDTLFKKENIVGALVNYLGDKLFDELLLRFCLLRKTNFYLVLHIVKIYPNDRIIQPTRGNTLLDDILNTSITNEHDNNIVLELIDELLKKGCSITEDIRIIKKKNIKLYIILKHKINIPNLILDDLIQFIKMNIKSYEEYIKNELLLNEYLIQQFNDYKIDGFSLLYTICSEENWVFLSILINVNEILKKSSINFNIINNDSTTLLNILKLKFPTIINDYKFDDDWKIEDLIKIILKSLN